MKWFKIIKIVLLVLIIFSLVSYIVMLLWNWLMPELFGLPQVNFEQSAGILLMSKILFGGFKKSNHGHANSYWKEKWHNIPEDKREKWKQQFADKWCGHTHTENHITDETKKDDQ
jgi:hypothetical protein